MSTRPSRNRGRSNSGKISTHTAKIIGIDGFVHNKTGNYHLRIDFALGGGISVPVWLWFSAHDSSKAWVNELSGEQVNTILTAAGFQAWNRRYRPDWPSVVRALDEVRFLIDLIHKGAGKRYLKSIQAQ